MRLVEMKGRVVGADTMTVTTKEIRISLYKRDDNILAIVEFDCDPNRVTNVRHPFHAHSDFHAASVNYRMDELIAIEGAPK